MQQLEEDAAVEQLAPITEAQWARILAGGQKFAILVKPEQQAWAGKRAVRCLNCAHLSDVKGDPRRGWCLEHRCMRSGAFPVLCRQFRWRDD